MATKTRKPKAVKLTEFHPSDRAMKFVDFARFAVNYGIEAYDVAHLITLAEKAFQAGVRYANSGSDRDDRANQLTGERFELLAKQHGFKVTWPGLWPRLLKADADGIDRDVYLPTFKD